MYLFQDARKKLKNSYFFQFLLEETGRNRKKSEETKISQNSKYLLGVKHNIYTYLLFDFDFDFSLHIGWHPGWYQLTDSTCKFQNQTNVKDAAIEVS